MPFLRGPDGRDSICATCFLTVVPHAGQSLCEAQRAHVCDVSEHDMERTARQAQKAAAKPAKKAF